MLGLTAPGDDIFARHFDVPERSVSESEAEQALAALGLLNPSDDALNWAAKSGAEGNYTYNNLTVDSDEGDITISSAKLFGAHMDGEVATFDRADFEGIKIYNEDEDVTVTVEALSVARPSPAMAKSIVAALSQLGEIDDLDENFDKDGMSFGALALNNVDIRSPEANGEIKQLVWGKDEQTNLADMKVEGFAFKMASKRKDEFGTLNLGSLIITELQTDAYLQLLDGKKARTNPLANYGLWRKTFDTVKLIDLDMDSNAFSLKTKGYEAKATQQGSVTKIVQTSEEVLITVKEPNKASQLQAFALFLEYGFTDMNFRSSQTSVLDEDKDTIKITDGLLTLKDGFELSYSYEAGGLMKAAEKLKNATNSPNSINTLKSMDSVIIDEVQFRLEDNTIVKRGFELAGKMQGSSAGALRTQAKLGLRLAPMAATGIEGKIFGELAQAMSEFIDGDKTLSIVVSPKKSVSISELTNLKNSSLSFEDLGFSAKAE